MIEDETPFAGFEEELRGAESALAAFAKGPARRAADEVGEAFERAGGRIAQALAQAGARGELSFKRLAKTVLEDLARLALDRIFTGAGAATTYFGARAAGGAVNPGGAYLVGERGPELFTPHTSGAVSPADSAAPIQVHFHLGAGADGPSVLRHEGQIAAGLARAIAYGRRNL